MRKSVELHPQRQGRWVEKCPSVCVVVLDGEVLTVLHLPRLLIIALVSYPVCHGDLMCSLKNCLRMASTGFEEQIASNHLEWPEIASNGLDGIRRQNRLEWPRIASNGLDGIRRKNRLELPRLASSPFFWAKKYFFRAKKWPRISSKVLERTRTND